MAARVFAGLVLDMNGSDEHLVASIESSRCLFSVGVRFVLFESFEMNVHWESVSVGTHEYPSFPELPAQGEWTF